MREKGTPSKRTIYQEQLRGKFPFYPDKPMRDVLGPVPSNPVDNGEGYKLRDKNGRVVRALSGIMQKGNVFKGTF